MGSDLLSALIALAAIFLPLCLAGGILVWGERKRPRKPPDRD
jgi:hypothetical protein